MMDLWIVIIGIIILNILMALIFVGIDTWQKRNKKDG